MAQWYKPGMKKEEVQAFLKEFCRVSFGFAPPFLSWGTNGGTIAFFNEIFRHLLTTKEPVDVLLPIGSYHSLHNLVHSYDNLALVHARTHQANGYKWTVDIIKKRLDRYPRRNCLVYVNAPYVNPTAQYYSNEEVDSLLSLSQESGGRVMILLDVIYLYLNYNNPTERVEWPNKGYYYIVHSLSKIFGLGGLRFGFVAHNDPSFATNLPSVPAYTDLPSQAVAMSMYKELMATPHSSFVRKANATLLENYHIMFVTMKVLGWEILEPKGSLMFCVRPRGWSIPVSLLRLAGVKINEPEAGHMEYHHRILLSIPSHELLVVQRRVLTLRKLFSFLTRKVRKMREEKEKSAGCSGSIPPISYIEKVGDILLHLPLIIFCEIGCNLDGESLTLLSFTCKKLQEWLLENKEVDLNVWKRICERKGWNTWPVLRQSFMDDIYSEEERPLKKRKTDNGDNEDEDEDEEEEYEEEEEEEGDDFATVKRKNEEQIKEGNRLGIPPLRIDPVFRMPKRRKAGAHDKWDIHFADTEALKTRSWRKLCVFRTRADSLPLLKASLERLKRLDERQESAYRIYYNRTRARLPPKVCRQILSYHRCPKQVKHLFQDDSYCPKLFTLLDDYDCEQIFSRRNFNKQYEADDDDYEYDGDQEANIKYLKKHAIAYLWCSENMEEHTQQFGVDWEGRLFWVDYQGREKAYAHCCLSVCFQKLADWLEKHPNGFTDRKVAEEEAFLEAQI